MDVDVHYARSRDLRIAYATFGDGPTDFVFVPGWVSHLESWWEAEAPARFFRRIASFTRLIMFDKRGTGLSDPFMGVPTLEERSDDVRAVMEAVGSTLLIVRELALRGACRYTDVRNGLPGIASNLLAERLRELERAGVIAREDAPPPIATTLFRLTPRGEQLRPVLEDLIRWGLPLMTEQKPGDAVRSHWLAWALESTLTDRQPEASPVTVELQTGDQPIVIETRDRAIHTRLGPAENPDATLTGAPKPILGLLLGLLELADAKANGVDYQGDPAILDRIGGPTAPSAQPS